jgi:DNA-binding FadR family transcriptional regulator
MNEPGSLIRSLSGRPPARNYHSYLISEIGVGIAAGRFPVGSILPNEGEIMDTHGVSRTVLREALKTLEAKGLVEARAKVGTRVLPKNRWNLFDRQVLSWIHEAGPDRAFLASFAQTRTLLETDAAGLAALHRTADQVRMMHYWLAQRLTTASMPEPLALAEFELHRTICEASHNPFLRAATGIVEFGLARAITGRVAAGIADLAEAKAEVYRDLVRAIEAGRREEARAAMAGALSTDEPFLVAGPGAPFPER